MTLEELRKGGHILDERGWLNVSLDVSPPDVLWSQTYKLQRILFLETIAGVPGMVAATLRHLTSLRLMVGYLSRLAEWN